MFHTFISNHAVKFVVVTGILMAVTMALQLNTGKCLKTDLTSNGILSLEFAGNREYADQIREEWKKVCDEVQPLCNGPIAEHPIIDKALVNIVWDFAFIAAYVSFLYVLVVLYGSNYKMIEGRSYTLLFCVICVLAGLCDVVENVLMISLLRNGSDYASWISAFAWTKFLLLALVGIYLFRSGRYLQRVSEFTSMLVRLLWKGRVSVIGLLVLYFALWKSDQGQDLLINLNASHWGPGALYIILTIMAAFYWYWPKYFRIEKWDPSPDVRFKNLWFGDWNPNAEPIDAAYMPRLLGLLTFLIPACGIMQALDIFEIPYVLNFLDPLVWLLISIVFFLVIVEYHLFERFFCATPRLYIAIIFALLALIGSLAFFNEYAPNDLGLLSIGLYAMAFIFVMVTTVRNDPDFYDFLLLRKFQSQKANTWMLSFVIVASITFLIFNFYPYITANGPYRFMTLPAVLTGVVFYTFVFFLLMIWGKKRKVNYPALVIAIAVVMAVVSDNKYHDLKFVDRVVMKRLPPLETYIHNWILSRKDTILSRKAYPVFIVNAYGGGIRAAAWTTMAVGLLDSITDQKFQNHVLAYSGASGGTIGASVLCAVQRDENMKDLTLSTIRRFYQNDFLTPVLIGLVGRDVWFSTLSIDWKNDRSRLQDSIWEYHLKPLANGYYSAEFSSLWYPQGNADYKIPLLFSNTYHVEKGLKGILAPVSLDSTQFESVVIVNNLLKSKSVLFSTGAFLSARFPYISPAGKIDDNHHFLDGGLKENSGAETAEEIYRVYARLAEKIRNGFIPPSDFSMSQDTIRLLYDRVSFHFLSLNNSISSDDPGPKRNLVELTAPFQALYNNWGGNTMKADSILRIRHPESFIELRPIQKCLASKYKPVLPLGWQISDGALTGMMLSLTDTCSENFRDINCIKSIIAGTSGVDCKSLPMPCSQ